MRVHKSSFDLCVIWWVSMELYATISCRSPHGFVTRKKYVSHAVMENLLEEPWSKVTPRSHHYIAKHVSTSYRYSPAKYLNGTDIPNRCPCQVSTFCTLLFPR